MSVRKRERIKERLTELVRKGEHIELRWTD